MDSRGGGAAGNGGGGCWGSSCCWCTFPSGPRRARRDRSTRRSAARRPSRRRTRTFGGPRSSCCFRSSCSDRWGCPVGGRLRRPLEIGVASWWPGRPLLVPVPPWRCRRFRCSGIAGTRARRPGRSAW
uniref:(northern house mosquito) hypothetical protein n=1 Tax=Culex pipiens TaxID=7175 RepID=A0A8D8FFR9_CULPI